MKVIELPDNESVKATIVKFFTDPNFWIIKDAFLSCSPFGGKDPTEVAINLGKAGAAAYIFNELEKIAKAKPKIKQQNKEEYGEQDPDLKDE